MGEEIFTSMQDSATKMIKRLDYYAPVLKGELVLLNNDTVLPLFLDKSQLKNFKKEYHSNITLKKVEILKMLNLDIEYYLINPMNEKIYVKKEDLDELIISDIYNKVFGLLDNDFEGEIHEMSEDDEKYLRINPLNICLNFDDKDEKKFIENIVAMVSSPFILRAEKTNQGRLIETVIGTESQIFLPIYSTIDDCLMFEEKIDMEDCDDYKLFIGSLNNIIISTNMNDHDIIINPETDNILITKELLKSIKDYLLDEIENENEVKDVLKYKVNEIINRKFHEIAIKAPLFNNNGYEIKIQLDDFKPSIWRELVIPSHLSFEALHSAIQMVMGFYMNYSYDLLVDDETIKDDFIDFEETAILKVFDYVNEIKYIYDDNWIFTIEIKNKIEYDNVYPILKSYEGEYELVEDCEGASEFKKLIDENSPELTKFNPEEVKENLEDWESYVV